MLIYLPVTSRPLIALQKEAVFSPCNFATTHLAACILNCYLGLTSPPMKRRNLAQRPIVPLSEALIANWEKKVYTILLQWGMLPCRRKSLPQDKELGGRCVFRLLSISRWTPFVAHVLHIVCLWGTHRNLIVSVSSQRLKGKSGAVPGAEALFGLTRA